VVIELGLQNKKSSYINESLMLVASVVSRAILTGQNMSFNKKIIGLLLSLLMGSGLAVAADFNKGLEAVEYGDFQTALAEWTPLAEQSNAMAQYNLGVMYDNGHGVPENDKTAVKWYTKAAEQGNAKAQSNLGFMYSNGEGVLTDTKRAYMWYNLASYNGNEIAGKNKDKRAKQMTPADISKAQDMSSRCLESNYTDC
jgi:TPR repeat protein